MKKALALILALVMMFTLAACAVEEPDETTTDTEATTTEATTTEATTTEATTTEATTEETTTEAPAGDATLGQTLKDAFLEIVNNGTTEPMAIIEALSQNEAIVFAPMAMEVEAGWLAGFSADITGFKSGAVLAPMIGSIPFVGYVFELEEGADVDAFVAMLNENANPRWNVCVEADEVICEKVGNTVFFLMSPTGFEE